MVKLEAHHICLHTTMAVFHLWRLRIVQCKPGISLCCKCSVQIKCMLPASFSSSLSAMKGKFVTALCLTWPVDGQRWYLDFLLSEEHLSVSDYGWHWRNGSLLQKGRASSRLEVSCRPRRCLPGSCSWVRVSTECEHDKWISFNAGSASDHCGENGAQPKGQSF